MWLQFTRIVRSFFISIGGVAERLKATDCKSGLNEYVGSNPAPSTRLLHGS